ncbi:hypothetical protein BH10BAC6_BH10BAC6_01470 [soil metagenome]
MKRFVVIALFLCATISYAQQKLTITFTGMSPHVGQLFQLRVVDKASSLEVAHHTILSLASTSFTLEMLCLEVGKSYNVDLYADLNKNGRYDAPPADHAWRLSVDNVTANVNVDFMHNTTWTDIAYPLPPTSYPRQVDAAWTGNWKNLTFNTTSSILTSTTFNFLTRRVSGVSVTSGAFGNPNPLSITAEGPFDPDADSAYLTPETPVTGWISFKNGIISGAISVSGATLTLAGDYGTTQMAMTYVMSGAFSANGVVIQHRGVVSGVDEEGGKVEEISVIPQPSHDVVALQWQQKGTEPARVDVFNTQGQLVLSSIDRAITTSHSLVFSVQAFPVGTYAARITAGASRVTIPIVVTR